MFGVLLRIHSLDLRPCPIFRCLVSMCSFFLSTIECDYINDSHEIDLLLGGTFMASHGTNFHRGIKCSRTKEPREAEAAARLSGGAP